LPLAPLLALSPDHSWCAITAVARLLHVTTGPLPDLLRALAHCVDAIRTLVARCAGSDVLDRSSSRRPREQEDGSGGIVQRRSLSDADRTPPRPQRQIGDDGSDAEELAAFDLDAVADAQGIDALVVELSSSTIVEVPAFAIAANHESSTYSPVFSPVLAQPDAASGNTPVSVASTLCAWSITYSCSLA